MDDYNLEPGELVVMQERSVKLGEGPDGDSLDELVLTNQSLILVATAQQGLFKRTRMLKRCPLAKIRRNNDVLQTFVSKYRNTYCLQIAFEDETVTLHFPANPKRGAERWAEAIASAADGNPISPAAIDLPPELTNVVDGAKDLVGALFGSSKPHRPPSRGEGSSSVTRKCVGCHAPLTGRVGSTVTCPYCDTKQTL